MWYFLNNLFEPKTNGPEVAVLLTSLLKVKVTATTLEKEIEEHPNYPSLLSLSDVLSNYGIENIAIKIDVDKLDKLPTPFITQILGIKSSTKYFTVVKEINQFGVQFFDPESHRWKMISKEAFSKRFLDVVLLAELGEKSGEKNYIQKIKAEKMSRLGQSLSILFVPLTIIIAWIIAFTSTGTASWLPIVFSFITLCGCAISILLLWYDIDQHNPALKQICSTGKKINCGAILQSKAAKIIGISWSTIGFTYFAGMLILMLFSGLTNSITLFTLSWLNVLVLPYVAYSIYYQWRIAKQWCALCLSIQALLILQFLSAEVGAWHSLSSFSAFTLSWIIEISIAFVLPFIATTILQQAMQKAKESKRLNIELQKLKHNKQIFEALLEKQQKTSALPPGMGITLGSPNARYRLLKVCSPYCGPCARAHQPMEELLENNNDLQLQIIFTASNSEGDIRTPPVKHLLAVAETNEEIVVKQALDDWYLPDKKDYEVFAAKYPLNGELFNQNAKVDAMRAWCDKTEIEYTPTFFVSICDNDNLDATQFYKLPQMYSVADLKYFFTV